MTKLNKKENAETTFSGCSLQQLFSKFGKSHTIASVVNFWMFPENLHRQTSTATLILINTNE